MIEPISQSQREQVITLTLDTIRRTEKLFATRLPEIPVLFDLKGRCAGMYRIRNQGREIRYNPYLFAKYFEDNIANTIPHEVAHFAADVISGRKRIKPHGPEWRSIMDALGARIQRTCDYDLTGIPVRKTRTWVYACRCSEHHISTYRHNQIRGRKREYFCRSCRGKLAAQPDQGKPY